MVPSICSYGCISERGIEKQKRKIDNPIGIENNG